MRVVVLNVPDEASAPDQLKGNVHIQFEELDDA
jgi:hypothetical protein